MTLRKNLELKARCPDLVAARRQVAILGARPGGVEMQADTYFHVPTGRLKLREIEGQAAVLIWYERPDQAEVRTSRYLLVPVADAGLLQAALSGALGVRGVVRKRREIHFWHNVRIHLDEVAGLGTFVEFEAVMGPEDEVQMARERLERLGQALEIAPTEHRAGSYADLMGW